jgi:hypothetical protein
MHLAMCPAFQGELHVCTRNLDLVADYIPCRNRRSIRPDGPVVSAHLDRILALLLAKHSWNHAESLRSDLDSTLEFVGRDPDQQTDGIESDVGCASQHLFARRRKPREYRKFGVRLTWPTTGGVACLHTRAPQSISGSGLLSSRPTSSAQLRASCW